MSVSTFLGIQTALRGLMAQQRALDTAGHNVANANTVGYSRQEAVMTPATAQTLPSGSAVAGGIMQLGTGVDVSAYRRIRDTFLDLQYRAQNMNLGDNATKSRVLEGAELALAEPGDNGLSTMMNKLWSAWSDVANAPESVPAREALVQQAGLVADAFQRLDSDFQSVGSQAAQEYASLAGAGGEVANTATEIAQLNATIKGVVSAGGQPNDLLDRRDALLDKLSNLGQVSITDLGGGAISVSFGDAAVPLVNDTTVTWPQALTSPGGRLGALIDMASPTGTIASYRSDLNAVAKQLADSINALHNPGGTGTNFFSYTAGSEASTLAVAVTPAGVRTSSTPAAGGNDIARAIAALRGGAADTGYTSLVSRIGSEVGDARRQESTSQVLVDSTEDRRQSTSGVSLDEEMTNIMRFQRAYQASARALSVMDEMLDVLVNRTGRVGL
jgi:flagellar hook-associated protein 1 FlgK